MQQKNKTGKDFPAVAIPVSVSDSVIDTEMVRLSKEIEQVSVLKNETVLVVGSDGNMGRRYCAILDSLGVKYVTQDSSNLFRPLSEVVATYAPTRAIVATPISSHVEVCENLMAYGIKKILCEKPIAVTVAEERPLADRAINTGTDIRMVCNWAYMSHQKLEPGTCTIKYDYYNSGKDKYLDWIQPVYLSKSKPEILNKSPIFKLEINGSVYDSTCIDMSYVRMIKDWLADAEYVWNLSEAILAHQKLVDWYGVI